MRKLLVLLALLCAGPAFAVFWDLHVDGDWDPVNNIPKLQSGMGQEGTAYRVSRNGTRCFGANCTWNEDDLIYFDHSMQWKRLLGANSPAAAGPATVQQLLQGQSNAHYATPFNLAGSSAIGTLTDAPIITWDMSLIANAIVTLAGNRAITAPTNPLVGNVYVLTIAQDSAGSRTVTWDASFKWGIAGVPVLTSVANARDTFAFYCTRTSPLEFAAFTVIGGY